MYQERESLCVLRLMSRGWWLWLDLCAFEGTFCKVYVHATYKMNKVFASTLVHPGLWRRCQLRRNCWRQIRRYVRWRHRIERKWPCPEVKRQSQGARKSWCTTNTSTGTGARFMTLQYQYHWRLARCQLPRIFAFVRRWFLLIRTQQQRMFKLQTS